MKGPLGMKHSAKQSGSESKNKKSNRFEALRLLVALVGIAAATQYTGAEATSIVIPVQAIQNRIVSEPPTSPMSPGVREALERLRQKLRAKSAPPPVESGLGPQSV